MNYKFVLIDPETGASRRQWVLSPPLVIGRCPTADITIGDASISRRHCQFLIDPYDSLVVRDLGSKNGVFVDERRVDKAIVRPGTEVRIGTIHLRPELCDEEVIDEVESEEVYDLDHLGETQPIEIIRPGAASDADSDEGK